MKRWSTLLLVLLFWWRGALTTGIGEPIEVLAERWVNQVHGMPDLQDLPSSIATDSAGNVYVGGHNGTLDTHESYYLATLAKFDGKTGALLWRWQSPNRVGYDTPGMLRFSRLAVGPDDCPIVMFGDEALMKFRGDGTVRWTVNFRTSHPYDGYGLALDSAGNAIVVGHDPSPYTMGCTKFDATDGHTLWRLPHYISGRLYAVKVDAAQDVIVTGELSFSYPGKTQIYTAKLAGSTGAAVWTAAPIDTTNYYGGRLLALDASGAATVATFDGRVLRYSGAGALQWQRTGMGTPIDMIADPAGDVYFTTGTSTPGYSTPEGSSTITRLNGVTGENRWQQGPWQFGRPMPFTVNLMLRGNELLQMGGSVSQFLGGLSTADGNAYWYRHHISPNTDVAAIGSRDLVLMASQPDGGVVVAGATKPPGATVSDINVVRFSPGPSLGDGGATTRWVLPTSVRFQAQTAANGDVSQIHWEYGATTAYGLNTKPISVGDIFPPPIGVSSAWLQSYAGEANGLAENTTYHARAVVVGTKGTVSGPDFTFTTGWDANGNHLPDEWEVAQFGNTSARTIDGDDDHDGLNTLLEYALGRKPLKPDAAGAMPVTTVGGHLTVTLTKRPYVTFVVEVSQDLQTWSSTPTAVVQDDATTLVVRDDFPPESPGPRFLRVRAVAP